MQRSVIVWDLETVPDLGGFAAANDLVGPTWQWERTQLSDGRNTVAAAPDRYTLYSTPLVGPDPVYCAAIGYTDGRTICPVRPEGTADREACENWRVGHARDNGRPGPTWTKADGSFCTGPASGCENHPSTQYSLFTYVPGTYIVTAENGAECTVSH